MSQASFRTMLAGLNCDSEPHDETLRTEELSDEEKSMAQAAPANRGISTAAKVQKVGRTVFESQKRRSVAPTMPTKENPMLIHTFCMALGLTGSSAAPDTLKTVPTDSLREVRVNIGLAPGLNGNGSQPEKVKNCFALNLAMNDAGAIDGLDVALGVARTRQQMNGLQVSGGANLVEGNLSGVQFSMVNLVQGGGRGAQASSLVNFVAKDFQGAQFSGINLVGGRMDGAQFGTMNKADATNGVQFSLLNIGGNVTGAQFGLVNIGKNVNGAQIGLVNISDTLNGAGIGLVNVSHSIRIQGDAWVTESGLSNVGIVTGTENFYMLWGANFDSPEHKDFAGWNVGVGARIRGEQAFGTMDIVSSTLVHDFDATQPDQEARRHHRRHLDWDANHLTSVRLAGGWSFFRHLEIYGGLSLNALASGEALDDRKFVTPPRDYQWDATSSLRIWPGAFAGVRI